MCSTDVEMTPPLTPLVQLALKHRQNRSQRQRIIVFICSPIADEQKELVQLAKAMKKGNTTIDFVLFGDLDDDATQKKLEAFNEAVKSNEGSHLVVFPPSSKLLGDQLVSSPILLGDNAGASGGGGAAGGNEEFEFGIDPALEPELALALRMSMEEEKARQEKKAKEEEEAAKKASLGDVKEEDEAGGSSKKDGGDKMDTS
jgi:26S proteasome regulatory subunit N10